MARNQNTNISIRRHVVEVFRELMADPDAGLELSRSATERLFKSVRSNRQGKTTSLDSVFKKYRYRA